MTPHDRLTSPPENLHEFKANPGRTALLDQVSKQFPPSIPLRNVRFLQLKGRALGPDLAKAYGEFLSWIAYDTAERQRQWDATFAKVVARFNPPEFKDGPPFSGLNEPTRQAFEVNARFLTDHYKFGTKDELNVPKTFEGISHREPA